MKAINSLCTGFISLFVLAGCANSQHINRADRHQFVTEFYAVVENVNKVKYQSNVGPAMAVGALDGILHNIHYDRDAMLGGALAGALFGGLVTAILEGPSTGYEYELEAVDGDVVTVILDYKAAGIGECVRVRVASTVSIVRQSMYLCESDDEI